MYSSCSSAVLYMICVAVAQSVGVTQPPLLWLAWWTHKFLPRAFILLGKGLRDSAIHACGFWTRRLEGAMCALTERRVNDSER